ncbi:hypothetical protein CISG_05163 [Coccidioides immitis RMSCC 3703]|uniref:Uncharacterized protein n=2 Tax=Coccidioides immitis TaxID=5501 RepID=A0A0J8QTI2_COCIT|nr:hypothetical protein CIRG_00151 [Coccidioides immitis RMSCC 2394]KMU75766.1 hypothetical protein CISG_05163 [Coccidioides immitis RMSCC 3703]
MNWQSSKSGNAVSTTARRTHRGDTPTDGQVAGLRGDNADFRAWQRISIFYRVRSNLYRVLQQKSITSSVPGSLWMQINGAQTGSISPSGGHTASCGPTSLSEFMGTAAATGRCLIGEPQKENFIVKSIW